MQAIAQCPAATFQASLVEWNSRPGVETLGSCHPLRTVSSIQPSGYTAVRTGTRSTRTLTAPSQASIYQLPQRDGQTCANGRGAEPVDRDDPDVSVTKSRPPQSAARRWRAMRLTGSMRAQIGTLVIATSAIQLANGFFGTFISLRV